MLISDRCMCHYGVFVYCGFLLCMLKAGDWIMI